MRLLVVSAQVLSIVQKGGLQKEKTNFGGWTMALIRQISKFDITVAVVMCGPVEGLYEETVEGLQIYVLPVVGKNKAITASDCDLVIESFKPDLIQIEGTEFRIQNEFSKNRGVKRLISLQGILNGYEPYQFGELPMDELLHSWRSPSNLIAAAMLKTRKRLYFLDRLKMELETLRNADCFTGRTFWDRAHSYWVNPAAEYHPCNRILRDEFYLERWSIDSAIPHRIYTSNGSTPLKGLHFVLKAVAILKKEYPDIQLYVAGPSSNCPVSLSHPKTLGYPLYIRSLIKKLDIEEQVHFTGMITAREVVRQLKQANVYVLPSLIENSPNSLGEAMLMGVPCVSSYAGGVTDMAPNGEVSLYRANDPTLLAWEVKAIFDSFEKQQTMSSAARERALITHDKEANAKAMIKAYESILDVHIGLKDAVDDR